MIQSPQTEILKIQGQNYISHLIDHCCARRAKNRTPIVIIGAVMTKLLLPIFGILRSGMPFDPTRDLCSITLSCQPMPPVNV